MISSTANSRVKHVVQLREKGRERKKEGVFLAEGIRMFQETPVGRIRELYMEETLAERPQTEDFSEKIEACRQAGIFVETVSSESVRTAVRWCSTIRTKTSLTRPKSVCRTPL